ncbi:hypothetical protein DL93DRAFT_2228691 [Clavulina sp. PMI_390]|nr:hypothetical protein DL93DRAFT_2228691 [Clavulina sp. PMI_390]
METFLLMSPNSPAMEPPSPSTPASPQFQPMFIPQDSFLFPREDLSQPPPRSQNSIAAAAVSLGVVFGLLAISLSGALFCSVQRRKARERRISSMRLATARSSFASRSANPRHRVPSGGLEELHGLDGLPFHLRTHAPLIDRRSDWIRLGLDAPIISSHISDDVSNGQKIIEKRQPVPGCENCVWDPSRCLSHPPIVRGTAKLGRSPLGSAPVWTIVHDSVGTISGNVGPEAEHPPSSPQAAAMAAVDHANLCESMSLSGSDSDHQTNGTLSSHDSEQDMKQHQEQDTGPSSSSSTAHVSDPEHPTAPSTYSRTSSTLSSSPSLVSASEESVETDESNIPAIHSTPDCTFEMVDPLDPREPSFITTDDPLDCVLTSADGNTTGLSPSFSAIPFSSMNQPSLLSVSFAALLSPHLDSLLASASSASLFKARAHFTSRSSLSPSSQSLNHTPLAPPAIMISPPTESTIYSFTSSRSSEIANLHGWGGYKDENALDLIRSNVDDFDLPPSGSWGLEEREGTEEEEENFEYDVMMKKWRQELAAAVALARMAVANSEDDVVLSDGI